MLKDRRMGLKDKGERRKEKGRRIKQDDYLSRAILLTTSVMTN